jgi:hypothetical protein
MADGVSVGGTEVATGGAGTGDVAVGAAGLGDAGGDVGGSAAGAHAATRAIITTNNERCGSLLCIKSLLPKASLQWLFLYL